MCAIWPASELGLLSAKITYLCKLIILVTVDGNTYAQAKNVAHAHFDLDETEFGHEQSCAGADDHAKGGALDFPELIYG